MSEQSSSVWSAFTQQNRSAWNEIARVREKTFPPAAYFAEGGITLDGRVIAAAREAFGEVRGLRVLHLQCATGEDTLSWGVLGAQAAGVDIAEEQIDLARQKADLAGIAVEFIAADVYELPQALHDAFDVVYTGGGALVWLPDLAAWARAAAACLKPGGRLLVLDEHPLAGCLWMQAGQLQIEGDYFSRAKAYEDTGWRHFQGGEDAREKKYSFAWPLGDVVTAAARAGLLVERLEEYPAGAGWRFGSQPGDIARMPGEFLLAAARPAPPAG